MGSLGGRIRKYRKEAEMSQEQLAEMLGVSRPTVSQIENGDRALSAEELGRLAGIFNTSADILLGLKKEAEVVILPAKGKKKHQAGIRINVPQKNLEKFKEVFLYILGKVGSKPNVGETVIYKLLYFIDFDFYEKYEEQLIGATYQKNIYGPTPVEFKKFFARMQRDVEKVKSKSFEYKQTKYLPKRDPDLSKLTASEVEVIDNVLNRLSHMTAGQISEYSHGDVPWLATSDGEMIEYETVFYRNPPYSVREYKDEL